MADFEDNPFADPSSINPFADPSVTQATETTPGVDDYNPFSEEAKSSEPSEPPRLPPPPTKAEVQKKKPKKKKEKPGAQWPPASDASSPAVLPSEEDKPPTYSPAPSSFEDPRASEINQREKEIAQREQALLDREKNLEKLGPIVRENNFPPFPSFCPYPLKPCFYLNIKVEIPPSEQWKTWGLLALMLYTWALLIINLFVSIYGAIVSSNDDRGQYLTTMGVAILYLVVCVPGSLFCWFIPIYTGYRKDSSLAFMWFFFVMLFQILGYVLNAIGIPNLGACGFFNGARLIGDNGARSAGGAMFIILGFLWLLAVPAAVGLVFVVHRYYRQSGQSLHRAMEEGVSGAAKNQYVRGAVKSGVSAGVKASMQS